MQSWLIKKVITTMIIEKIVKHVPLGSHFDGNTEAQRSRAGAAGVPLT